MQNKIILLVLSIIFSSVSYAYDEQEYNYKLKHEDWIFTHRSRENTYHFEVGKKLWGTEYTYRYADLNGTIENRIKFTTDLFSHGGFTLKGRTEYRNFDNEESHWRWRFIAEYNPHLYGNLYLFTRIDPRWSFKDAGTAFDSRDQIGITYKATSWRITPFLERNSTEGYHMNQTVGGIHWEANI